MIFLRMVTMGIKKMKKITNIKNKLIFLGIFSQVAFLFYGFLASEYGYYFENSLTIFLIILLDLKWDKMKINNWTFGLVLTFFSLHASGIFGFYNISPFPIPFDWILHFFGMFVLSIVLLNWLGTNAVTCSLVILAVLGVGSLIETTEYIGYLGLGEGEGLLFYGSGDIDDINYVGGGWINTMVDLIFNTLGALIGLFVFMLSRLDVVKE